MVVSDTKKAAKAHRTPGSTGACEKSAVENMYRDMGKAFAKLDTWSIYILTSHEQFEQFYGKPATKKRKLFNGFIRTDLYQYWGPRPPRNQE